MSQHKLLVVNRGEIAIRILRTAKRLQISTVAIYALSDATSPHVSLADEAIPLRSDDLDPVSNSRGYLGAQAIVDTCIRHNVTFVHPGYGFLSENVQFAALLVEKWHIIWLGAAPKTTHRMGLKHQARALAIEAKVPVVPGADRILADVNDAVAAAVQVGFPVMLKSIAGGGGMGLLVCYDEDDVHRAFPVTHARAMSLFDNAGLFIERYFPAARHIEIQVFGDGTGHGVHMGERECSVQRRYHKVIEETATSPFLMHHPEVFEQMCAAAIGLCELIKYASAGTLEFLVDDHTAQFFFPEMNTRIQVEHPITECRYPGLDIVELMIRLGLSISSGLSEPFELKCPLPVDVHVIEVRVYCENATEGAGFKPSPGVLQYVEWMKAEWLRVDTWVETGTTVTPFFDPLIAKIVVSASSRAQAIERMLEALGGCKIYGPTNNVGWIKGICESRNFREGRATTAFAEEFVWMLRAIDVVAGGIETAIQDYPGRTLDLGLRVPHSGPVDSVAFRVANLLVGNDPGMEGLEMTIGGSI